MDDEGSIDRPQESAMHGRAVHTHLPAHPTDPYAADLNRRVALALTRRWKGTASAAHPATVATAAPILSIALRSNEEMEAGAVALDQRVRETGEW
jgi:hypothetical protein